MPDFFHKRNKLIAETIIFVDKYNTPLPIQMKKIFFSCITIFSLSFPVSVNANSFIDVSQKSPYYTSIEYFKNGGRIHGYQDGRFLPHKTISRAAFIKLIIETSSSVKNISDCNFLKNVKFRDVQKQHWFAPYICTANENGIIHGYSDNTFRPSNEISLAGAAKILTEAFHIPLKTKKIHDPWYAPHIAALQAYDIIPNGLKIPSQKLTRGETVEMLYKIIFTDVQTADTQVLQKQSIHPVHAKIPTQQKKSIETANTIGNKKQYQTGTALSPASSCEKYNTKKCFYGEKYDKNKNQCIFQCGNIRECQSLSKKIEKRMSKLFSPPPTDHKKYGGYTANVPTKITTYAIDNGTISKKEDENNIDYRLLPLENDVQLQKKIWRDIVQVFPKQYLELLTEFQIFSDGAGLMTGEVYKVIQNDQQTGWGIAIDPADIDDIAYTLLHELAHTIDIYQSRPQCESEGIFTNENRYLQHFTKQFWEPYGDTFTNLQGMNKTNREKEIETLSKKYKDFFLTDYALKNSEEDFSESFAHFVLLNKPSTKTIADQKIQFFYDYPELVHLRSSLRWVLFSRW